MLTIEIPDQIRDLVATAKRGEFPASCWAAEIVSNWLWDITKHAGYDDPEKCPMARALCEELGITEGHDEFINAGGPLFRNEAKQLLLRARGTTPDRPAFLKVSAMVLGWDICPEGRNAEEMSWRDVIDWIDNVSDLVNTSALPLPVWQCLLRYFSDDWRDPITAWKQATKEYFEAHVDELSYSDDQKVPFPVTT